jgi:hypothetical protein
MFPKAKRISTARTKGGTTVNRPLPIRFRELAEALWLESEDKELTYQVGITEGQAKAYMQAAQMLEESLKVQKASSI